MLQRLYAHNFRCFENFEFNVELAHSSLLIGRNGSGKSTLAAVLEIFQQIGRGTSKISQLIVSRDFSYSRTSIPMRLEMEVMLNKQVFSYSIGLELPEGFRDLRVIDESLNVNGIPVYIRKQAEVALNHKGVGAQKTKGGAGSDAQFRVDWHQIALPLIQERSDSDPLHIFRKWLAQMVILAPQPRQMNGESSDETLQPMVDGTNFTDWLAGLLSQFPAAYGTIDSYLREVMPDLQDFRNEVVGSESKRLLVNFARDSAKLALRFDDLSDGEKCFFLCATILAANKSYGPLFCFWDEPDNYLSLHEVGHFIAALRRGFQNNGQIVMTSHNEEAILRFSGENTWLLGRKSHLEPTQIRKLLELRKEGKLGGDLIQALISGELTL
ncbi:MAG: AAA family ATPase [Burkholderiaceae bacterium]|nr:AAA family ATPase [Burkholderiaceae bacterium]